MFRKRFTKTSAVEPITVYWGGRAVGHVDRPDGVGNSWIGEWRQANTGLAYEFASRVNASLEVHYETRVPVEVEVGPDRSLAEITDLGNGLIAWLLRPSRLAGGSPRAE